MTVGTGQTYSAISEAVAAANPGDSVLISAGVYEEQVDIDKEIAVGPLGAGDVWIDGGCRQENGLHISGSGVRISGIGIRMSAGAAILIEDGASRIRLEELVVQDFNCREEAAQSAAGIAVHYGGQQIEILDSVIARRVNLPGNARGYGNGIWFKSDSQHPSGGGHRIAGNQISGGFDGIGGETEQDTRGSFDKNSVIEGNTISDCWDDGIQVEGGNRGIHVRDNVIQGCASGVAMAPNLKGPLYVERNRILDLVPGFHGDHAAFKIGGSGGGIAYLRGNTVNTEGEGIKQAESGLSIVVSEGNVLRVTGYVLEVQDTPPDGSSFNRDCLWSEDPSVFVKWAGAYYRDLTGFSSTTGMEMDGQQEPGCG